ncbi:ATP-binding protein [Dermatobacter hominis]|uniref:ATP-binding protein n=1 Tax=Dermatobacter hominis TaxID=2884263 RepID=UPI001D12CEE9|nr:ATP-binding protein [Dermatobacter hominis]UDY35013.1 AAA family ATPase [Dermatobacter hominis]
MSDNVFDALERALEAGGDVTLRLHLVEQLLQAGRARRALEHCQALLAADPGHLDALTYAANAADDVGQNDLAAVYRRRRESIEGGEEQFERSEEESPPVAPVVLVDTPADERIGVHVDGGPPGAFEVERPTVTLDDVAGLEDVKRHLEETVLVPMESPELREAFGLSVGGGLLLWGPPGCGKTFLARALAGRFGAGFIAIGMSDVLDIWLGNSERNLHELFATARGHVRTTGTPCVVFVDEIDGLGVRRSKTSNTGIRTVVTQLLTELDGVEAANDGLFVVGATNQPWDIDPALRRPGRFDRTVCVLPPDRAARFAILAAGLEGKPLAPTLEVSTVADRTDLYSGADLAHLTTTALRGALAASRRAGRVVPVDQEHVDAALAEVRPSTIDWLGTARSAARYTSDPAMFEPLVAYLRARGRW